MRKSTQTVHHRRRIIFVHSNHDLFPTHRWYCDMSHGSFIHTHTLTQKENNNNKMENPYHWFGGKIIQMEKRYDKIKIISMNLNREKNKTITKYVNRLLFVKITVICFHLKLIQSIHLSKANKLPLYNILRNIC